METRWPCFIVAQGCVTVSIQSFCHRWIDSSVLLPEHAQTWRLTNVYGEPDTSKQRAFWNSFKSLKNYNPLPWLCLGDWNEVLLQDKFLGAHSRPEWQVWCFWEVLSQCNINDHVHEGLPFTWNRNMRQPCAAKGRLDRALASSDWLSLFPYNKVEHMFSHLSDHKPILVTASEVSPEAFLVRSKRRFRFEATWTNELDCEDLIRQAWHHDSSLTQKLLNCKNQLIAWRKNSSGNFKKEISWLQDRIDSIQQGPIMDNQVEELEQLSARLDFLLEQDDLYWK